MQNVIYFEKNKTLDSLYYLKESNLNVNIPIKTERISISDNKIEINYLVIDSEEKFEYIIEMSD